MIRRRLGPLCLCVLLCMALLPIGSCAAPMLARNADGVEAARMSSGLAPQAPQTLPISRLERARRFVPAHQAAPLRAPMEPLCRICALSEKGSRRNVPDYPFRKHFIIPHSTHAPPALR